MHNYVQRATFVTWVKQVGIFRVEQGPPLPACHHDHPEVTVPLVDVQRRAGPRGTNKQRGPAHRPMVVAKGAAQVIVRKVSRYPACNAASEEVDLI